MLVKNVFSMFFFTKSSKKRKSKKMEAKFSKDTFFAPGHWSKVLFPENQLPLVLSLQNGLNNWVCRVARTTL